MGFIHVILVDESQVDAGIVILDDNIVEYNENFTVRFVRPIPCDLCQLRSFIVFSFGLGY